MKAQTKGNLEISGSGTGSGGVYDSVAISGSGKITGDVEARQITISGTGEVQGSVNARSFSGSGSFSIRGNLEAGAADCSGSGEIAGSVTADSFRTSGTAKVAGKVKAGEVELSGSSEFNCDLEAERFRSRGSFAIGGLLSADEVEIVLGGHSRAREIGGEQITVVRAAENRVPLWWRWATKRAMLEAEVIEGDGLYLEGTRATMVRGRQVTIGRGCHIQSVEYSECLRIDPEASVAGHSYTGQPPSPAPVENRPVRRPKGWASDHCYALPWGSIQIGGREIRNPVLRVVAAAFGLSIAAVAVGGVLFLVLPAVGVIVSLVLGGVAVLLVVLAVGIPILLIGAGLMRVLLLPVDLLRCLFRGKGAKFVARS